MAVSRREVFQGLGTSLVTLIAGTAQANAAPRPGNDAAAMKNRFGEKLRRTAKLLDELQQDIFAEDWELIATYPNAFRSFVPVFTKYTDAAFPGDDPVAKNSRVALRYEVGRLFGAVERLRRAADAKNTQEAEGAFAAMSVALDRYLKAGDLYDAYDPVTSTEKYFKGTDDSTLVFVPPARDPPKIRDSIMLVAGPDKGRTGRMIGEEVAVSRVGAASGSKKAIIKLNTTLGGIREIKVVPYEMVAKTLQQG